MITPLKAKGRKLYDIPICTICLEPMIKDLAVFCACGHVFHYNCGINAHSNSRKCPNCRHRSTEVQSLHYAVEEISGVDEQMHLILSNLSKDQQTQMAKLLSDHETLLNDQLKITQRSTMIEDKYNKLQTSYQETLNENARLVEYNKALDDKKRDLTMRFKQMEIAFEALQDQQKNNEELIQIQSRQLTEYSYLKNIQSALTSNEEDTYVKSLRMKTPQEQAQQIYDMYIMKSGQFKQIQLENDRITQELESIKKRYDRTKQQSEELSKENQSIREYVRNKQIIVHKQENEESVNSNSIMNKRKVIEKPPTFGSQLMRKQVIGQYLIKKP